MNKQLQQIQDGLNATFFDREAESEALLTGVLARQHVLFIGPAGIGKSYFYSTGWFSTVKGHFFTPFMRFRYVAYRHCITTGIL